jgi:hypothetical protein
LLVVESSSGAGDGMENDKKNDTPQKMVFNYSLSLNFHYQH